MKRVKKNEEFIPHNNNTALIQSVRHVLANPRILSYASRVIVGVSGGPDSMALLYCLLALRHELGLEIVVAHFNHRIRKTASDDERFVHRVAQQHQLTYVSQTAKSRPPVKGSIEDWAREQRLDFLIKLSAQLKADAVCLAHTADDLAETVLMRLIRGTGLYGLSAMSVMRIIHGVKIIRPLLSVKKSDLLEFLKANHSAYCVDETNQTVDFFRNKVRLDLLPYLIKEYNPNMAQVLVNLSQTSAQDYDFIFTAAQNAFDQIIAPQFSRKSAMALKVKSLRAVHPALQRVIIRLAYQQIKGDLNLLTFDHVERVEQLLMQPTGQIILPNKICVQKDKSYVWFKSGKVL